MTDLNESAIKAQARFAKARTFGKNAKQASLVQSVLPVINRIEIEKTHRRQGTIETETSELKRSLASLENWMEATKCLLSDLQQFKEGQRKAMEAVGERFEDIKAHFEDNDKKFNTFQNCHEAFQAKIETKFKAYHTRIEGIENDCQDNAQELQNVAFLAERKEAVMQLLHCFGTPEAREFLKAPFRGFDPVIPAEPAVACEEPESPHYSTACSSVTASAVLETNNTEEKCSVEEEGRHISIASDHGQPPTSLVKFVDLWNFFKEKYDKGRPRYEHKFIRSFFEAFKPSVARLLQETVLAHCPTAKQKFQPAHGSHCVALFVDTRSLTWLDLNVALNELDYEALQLALRYEDQQSMTRRAKRDNSGLANNSSDTHSKNKTSNQGPLEGQWSGEGDVEL